MDSTPLWILKELMNEKGMETFRMMLKKDLIIDMESTMPPMTGPAWPTIYTGLTPAEHGVPDFFVMKENYTPDVIFYDSEKMPPFWKKLCESGMQALIITPATDIRLPKYGGIDMITGFPLKSKANTNEMLRLMKKYRFYGERDIEGDMKAGKMTLEEGANIFADTIKRRILLSDEAIKNKDYDFVFICFTETDRLQHFVMNNDSRRKYLLPIYSQISQFVGKLIKDIDENGGALIIVSDHGMQPIYNKFLINSWFEKQGYLTVKRDTDAKQNRNENKSEDESLRYKVRETLMKSKLRRVYDKLPHSVKSLVFSTLGRLFSQSNHGKYTRMHLFDFDMKKTRAFAAISYDPVSTIWINDWRFENGIVSKKDKAKLKKEIIGKLKLVKAADGSKMMENVYDGDSYYKGTDKFLAADIITEARKGYTVDIFNFSEETNFMKPEIPKSGDHMRNGILGFYFKDAKPLKTNANVLNIEPTILEYYGIKSIHSKNSILKKMI
jgi:predicted AlkP superfamily phosphohydrolase/phosphomutase